jgi:hypothetical protein
MWANKIRWASKIIGWATGIKINIGWATATQSQPCTDYSLIPSELFTCDWPGLLNSSFGPGFYCPSEPGFCHQPEVGFYTIAEFMEQKQMLTESKTESTQLLKEIRILPWFRGITTNWAAIKHWCLYNQEEDPFGVVGIIIYVLL